MAKKKNRTEALCEDKRLKTNFYINKNGEIIQKVTVHFPSDMVDRLKLEALKRKITLSELIRERLK